MARRRFQDPPLKTRMSSQGMVYYIRYRVPALEQGPDGKPIRVDKEKWETIGLASEMSQRQAERERAKILGRVNGQVYKVQSQIPMKDFIALYLENHVSTLAEPTQVTYRQWIGNYILPYFGPRRLCDITPIDVQAFLGGLDLAPLTRNAIRGILSSVYAAAKEWGYWTEESPVRRHLKRKAGELERVRPRRIPTPEGVRQILEAVDDDRRLIIETLIWTGVRISECLGLRPRHFELERGVVRIEERQCRGNVGRTKTPGSERYIPLGDLAERYAARIAGMSPEQFVFTDAAGEPYKDCELLANYLTPRLVKLGLKFPGFGWHTFRRLLATWMEQGGASIPDIMAQLGHTKASTTKLYIVGGGGNVKRRADIISGLQKDFRKASGNE